MCEIDCSSARRLLGGPGLDVGRAVGAKGEALGGASKSAARADLPAAAAVNLFLKKKTFYFFELMRNCSVPDLCAVDEPLAEPPQVPVLLPPQDGSLDVSASAPQVVELKEFKFKI